MSKLPVSPARPPGNGTSTTAVRFWLPLAVVLFLIYWLLALSVNGGSMSETPGTWQWEPPVKRFLVVRDSRLGVGAVAEGAHSVPLGSATDVSRADDPKSLGPVCRREVQQFSISQICKLVFSGTAAKVDAQFTFPDDEAEKNRRRIMGATPLDKAVRTDCGDHAMDFTGMETSGEPIHPTSNHDNSSTHTSLAHMDRVVRHGNCRYRLLLIVIFNGNFYANMQFIRKLYERGFSKVVFYGEKDTEGKGVRRSPYLWGGYRQHVTIAQAMMEHPGYDGYWWIGDDVLLNFPFLFSTMNLENVWTTRREPIKGRVFPSPNQTFADNQDRWIHWTPFYGMPAIQKLYRCIRPMYVKRMPAAYGCSHCVVYMGSDAGYVPRRFVDSFIELSYVFKPVLHEIALPTILRLIVPDIKKDLYEDFHTHMYLWSNLPVQEKIQIEQNWKHNTSFAHPYKFSNKFLGSRDFARKALKEAEAAFALDGILEDVERKQ